MALKGAISKQKAADKILEMFNGAFAYEKEIRIPMEENGEIIQLKCVLTCAKTNVEPNGDKALPGEVKINDNQINFEEKKKVVHSEPTQEERENVQKLMQMLNL